MEALSVVGELDVDVRAEAVAQEGEDASHLLDEGGAGEDALERDGEVVGLPVGLEAGWKADAVGLDDGDESPRGGVVVAGLAEECEGVDGVEAVGLEVDDVGAAWRVADDLVG